MTPMNFDIGLSQSDSTSMRSGNFSGGGDFIVTGGGGGQVGSPGASGGGGKGPTTATNWGLIVMVAGLVLVALAALAVFGKRKS